MILYCGNRIKELPMMNLTLLRFVPLLLALVMGSCDLFSSKDDTEDGLPHEDTMDVSLTGLWKGIWVDTADSDTGRLLFDLQEDDGILSGKAQSNLPTTLMHEFEGTLAGSHDSASGKVTFTILFKQDTVTGEAFRDSQTIAGAFVMRARWPRPSGTFSVNKVGGLTVGCAEPWADNYDPAAEWCDTTCYRSGCFDPTSHNFDPMATQDCADCCLYEGCTDPSNPAYFCNEYTSAYPCTGANGYTPADITSDPGRCTGPSI